MPELSTIYDYMRAPAALLGDRILQEYPALHQGKFAGEGLQSIDEDDDMLSAMARKLVERNGIGGTADAVWRALNLEPSKLFPVPPSHNDQGTRPDSPIQGDGEGRGISRDSISAAVLSEPQFRPAAAA